MVSLRDGSVAVGSWAVWAFGLSGQGSGEQGSGGLGMLGRGERLGEGVRMDGSWVWSEWWMEVLLGGVGVVSGVTWGLWAWGKWCGTVVLGGILLGVRPVLARMPDIPCVFGVTDVKLL